MKSDDPLQQRQLIQSLAETDDASMFWEGPVKDAVLSWFTEHDRTTGLLVVQESVSAAGAIISPFRPDIIWLCDTVARLCELDSQEIGECLAHPDWLDEHGPYQFWAAVHDALNAAKPDRDASELPGLMTEAVLCAALAIYWYLWAYLAPEEYDRFRTSADIFEEWVLCGEKGFRPPIYEPPDCHRQEIIKAIRKVTEPLLRRM